MLHELSVTGFKTLRDITIPAGSLTVLLGPNSVGKSNVLEAIQLLSGLSTQRTFAEAMEPLRGTALECYTLPDGGWTAEDAPDVAQMSIGAKLWTGSSRYRYSVNVAVRRKTGTLELHDETLSLLRADWEPNMSRAPVVDVKSGEGTVRSGSQGRPFSVEGLNHSLLQDPRWTDDKVPLVGTCRAELAGWNSYYLDPREAMRGSRGPESVSDIGAQGAGLAPFLNRLKFEHEQRFQQVTRLVRQFIPEITEIGVATERSGLLNVTVRQDGTPVPLRLVSEGTLRMIALASIAVNPWAGSLVAFEEPENGIHPKRIRDVAHLLVALSKQRQLIVTTHSPLLCARIREVAVAEERADATMFLRVMSRYGGTEVRSLDLSDGLLAAWEEEVALDDADRSCPDVATRLVATLTEMMEGGWLDVA